MTTTPDSPAGDEPRDEIVEESAVTADAQPAGAHAGPVAPDGFGNLKQNLTNQWRVQER